jgi:1-deoxy-D-xylulose-5-phosphate reductoisomerase
LEFIDINQIDFPSIKFARDALVSGGIMPAVMNAANEIAVERFINNEIKFDLIFDIIEHVMEKFDLEESIIDPTLDQIINADEKARLTSVKYIKNIK